MQTATMDKIVSLCKRRGFIFQNSEIYGGLGSTWDYGPLGTEFKRNVKKAWWKSVVYERDDIEGLDAAILMHPKTWVASGHVQGFFDVLVDCKSCKKRFKVEQLTERGKKKLEQAKCPECGGTAFTQERPFNLMFKTFVGPVEDTGSQIFLRPETAQGIFVNFANVLNSTHRKLPFGIAQIGKAFRNEVTTGNFTFRSREFEQMEIEYFVQPKDADQCHKSWIQDRLNWYLQLGIKRDNLRVREHEKGELAHYAKACADIEYKFPFGWSELEGIANRTDFDLVEHAKHSGKDLGYFDEETKQRITPYIIEPSGGVDRTVLAFLADAYREETVRERKRVVLGLDKSLSPIKVAVLPLLKNRPEIVDLAKSIAADLRKDLSDCDKKVVYDDTASIGRLYRRQDEIGTIFCLTVDVESLEDKKVTVRERDSMQQERISIDRLKQYLKERL
ncbi:MAG: glycine--tRNA ligase [Candidatus Omnitrophica bacterium]|nr:glycine--tRNA ligase [Candidatus Omnitrophota bacterium]